MACPAAASTSPTRPSTAMSPTARATKPPSSGRARTAPRRPTPTPTWPACPNKLVQRPAQPRRQEGRPRLRLPRPHPGALRRRLRHAEGRLRHRAAVLRLRPGRRQGPPGELRRRRLPHQPRRSGERVKDIRAELPALKHVIHVQHGKRTEASDGILSYDDLMAQLPTKFADREAPASKTSAIMHYTSGTTGKPKGAVHVHQAVWGHYATGKYVLDLHPDDIYWCTADPGWVTGTSYGMFAPFTNGVTSGHLRRRLLGVEVVRDHPEVQGHRLVHGADGDPPADEGRRAHRRSATTSPACATRCPSASP